MFLATEVLCRDEFALGGNIMSKRLLVALLGAGFTCATLSAQELPLDSSTNANSARQRDDQRPDRSVAGESTSGLGIRSQRHIHRHH